MTKTILISGATSGLGKATAVSLAKQGCTLILTGRSDEKGKALLNELERNDHSYYTGNFSSIASTKKLADDILKNHDKIDVILNNAGAVFSSFELTEDGIEKTITTNHLGYFILTLKLLPILNKATGRIVNVSSRSHYKKRLDIESFTEEKKYFILEAYGQSKLANIMFTYSLVDRLKQTGITVNALHPGMVKTKIGGKAKKWLHNLGWWVGAKTSGISIQDGIKTHLYLVTSEEMNNRTGEFYYNLELRKTSEESNNKDLQEQLWKWSEDVTGITWSETEAKMG